MKPYGLKRRTDGVRLINITTVYENIMLATRVVAANEIPIDLVAVAAICLPPTASLRHASLRADRSGI